VPRPVDDVGGTRLSITPVDPLHFKRACKLAGFK
jgi:hypothetical protein